MKRTLFLAASAFALCAPVAAQADNMFSGTLTAGYSFGSASIDGGGPSMDINTASLRGDLNLMFSESFDAQLGFTLLMVDPDLGPVDLSLMGLEATANYHFGGGWSAGLYLENGDLDINNAGILSAISPEHQAYGVTLAYATSNWQVEGFLGGTKIDPLDELVDYDILSYGLNGTFMVNEQLTIGGHITRSDIDIETISTDAMSVGIGAFYDINDQFSVYGGLSNVSFDDFGADVDLTAYSLGLAYTLAGDSALPATLSLELVRNDLSASLGGPSGGAKIDEVRFGVSIPLGKAAANRPLNSHALQTMQGHHDVFSAILPLY